MSSKSFNSDKIDIPKLTPLAYSTAHQIQGFVLRHNLIPLLIAGSLVGAGLSGYLFYQYYQTQQLIKAFTTKQVLNKEEVKSLVLEVEKIAKLPDKEEPSVATVTDINKLKGQPFFADGKNGDRVLVYANAQKIILYDPISKKIINIAPLSAGNTQAASLTQTPSPAPAQNQAKIVLRNSTLVAGLASKIELDIKKTFPLANIISKDNTAKDFPKTVVVVLSETARDAALNLAKALNSSVADLPSGEIKPNGADILVIIGKDKS